MHPGFSIPWLPFLRSVPSDVFLPGKETPVTSQCLGVEVRRPSEVDWGCMMIHGPLVRYSRFAEGHSLWYQRRRDNGSDTNTRQQANWVHNSLQNISFRRDRDNDRLVKIRRIIFHCIISMPCLSVCLSCRNVNIAITSLAYDIQVTSRQSEAYKGKHMDTKYGTTNSLTNTIVCSFSAIAFSLMRVPSSDWSCGFSVALTGYWQMHSRNPTWQLRHANSPLFCTSLAWTPAVGQRPCRTTTPLNMSHDIAALWRQHSISPSIFQQLCWIWLPTKCIDFARVVPLWRNSTINQLTRDMRSSVLEGCCCWRSAGLPKLS